METARAVAHGVCVTGRVIAALVTAAAAAREASERHGKPVLTATELVHTSGDYGNAGPKGLREEGRLCHASAHRAVRALRALVDYAEFRGGAGARGSG